jgi:asparagine synthase (glutamine-hydrolysing)
MSIIFGIRGAEGNNVEERRLLQMAKATTRYALDGIFVGTKGRIGMGFQPYLTHERSHLESQPFIDACGNMVTFDGRLDNHRELRQLLNIEDENAADSIIILTAFRRWEEECFAHLTGDWSLVLWSEQNSSLYLARDHAGTRSLYFEQKGTCIIWSTYLETFFAEEKRRSLDEVFAVRYISGLPGYDFTPYRGITAVPPAHFIRFRENSVLRRPHWQWLQSKTISYPSDGEYEAHFRSLFRQAVQRRTGPGAPILAELSGGMDSTSIVCMSDHLRKEADDGKPIRILDTVSYYDDSEPDWNERKYFEITEQHRGRPGVHLSATLADRSFQPPSPEPSRYLLPGADLYTSKREMELRRLLDSEGYRVILSGTGGDEVLGGVPSPDADLGDCLVSGKFGELLTRAFVWCLNDRTPLIHRLFHTARYITGLYTQPEEDLSAIPAWIKRPRRTELNPFEATGPMSGRRLGSSPSSLSNAQAWWSILYAMPSAAHNVGIRYETRYPYLDKDLVNFLFRIPRNQIVRPGQRRSLMRRAMRDIVPSAILGRPRKGFIRRATSALFQAERARLLSLFERSRLEDYGLIDRGLLQKVLHESDGAAGVPPILRAGWFELWLQSSAGRIAL